IPADLGSDDALVAVRLQGLAQEFFTQAVAVEVGRIEKGTPQLQSPGNSAQRFGIVCRAIAVAVLIATYSPGAKAHLRNLQICPPQTQITHAHSSSALHASQSMDQ